MKKITEYILPQRIVAESGCITGQENLFKQKPKQIGLNEKDTIIIKGKSHIILDFGFELTGGIRILTFLADKSSANIRLRFGESVSETSAEIGENNATNDHTLRDITVTVMSYSDMEFCNTGFRFVRIDTYEKAEITLKSIYAKFTRIDEPNFYSYSGKDPLITKIFQVAKRTIDLCINDYVWDGVKRDRLVWVGDMHPEMLAITALYGKNIELERSLDFAKEQAKLPEYMNDMPSYSLWWIIIIADYYKLAGAKAFAENQLEYLNGLISHLNSLVADSGEMLFPSYFLDWQLESDFESKVEGVRALFILASSKAAELYKSFNLSASVAEEIKAKLVKKQINSDKKQVIALKYFALGEVSDSEAKILTENGANGISCFMSYYILTAIAKTSGKDKAIEIMKDYFGAMLDLGATSFFEDFDIDSKGKCSRIDELSTENLQDFHRDYGKYCYKGYRHSLCHGWSSGIIAFIKEFCE